MPRASTSCETVSALFPRASTMRSRQGLVKVLQIAACDSKSRSCWSLGFTMSVKLISRYGVHDILNSLSTYSPALSIRDWNREHATGNKAPPPPCSSFPAPCCLLLVACCLSLPVLPDRWLTYYLPFGSLTPHRERT